MEPIVHWMGIRIKCMTKIKILQISSVGAGVCYKDNTRAEFSTTDVGVHPHG
jgi:hypothetical protein